MKKIIILFLALFAFSNTFAYNPFPKFGGLIQIVNKQYVGNSIEFDVVFTNLSGVERYLYAAEIDLKFNIDCFSEAKILINNLPRTKQNDNYDTVSKVISNLKGENIFGTGIYRKTALPGMNRPNNKEVPEAVITEQAKEMLLTIPANSEAPVLLSHYVVEGFKGQDCYDNIEIIIDNNPYPQDFSSIVAFVDRMPWDSSWSMAKFLLYRSWDELPDPNLPTSVDISKDYSKDIKIIPNPVMNIASLRIPGYNGMANVEIYTPEGSLINRSSVEFYGADAPLQVSKLSSGWYFVKIYIDNGILLGTKPLVIVK